ncbi:MAG: glycosyltransferase, partial [Hyphomonadaceae bacterium]
IPADAIEDVHAATYQGRNPIALAHAAVKIVAGVLAALARFARLKPALVIGFGGYPSVPALWAARARKTPIVIYQADTVLGRVNRYFAPAAAAVACAYDRLDKLDPRAADRKVVVGLPIRPAVRAVRDVAYAPIEPGGRIGLLVTGGSQGARLFGEVIPRALAMLPEALRARLQAAIQVREEQIVAVRAVCAKAGVRADVAAFFTDMPERLAAAHLVIGRAGGTVAELACAGRPAILVPLAIAADDHQTSNAQVLAQAGGADVIAEGDFTPEALCALLAERFADPAALAARAAAARALGRPDAAQALADAAERVAALRA